MVQRPAHPAPRGWHVILAIAQERHVLRVPTPLAVQQSVWPAQLGILVQAGVLSCCVTAGSIRLAISPLALRAPLEVAAPHLWLHRHHVPLARMLWDKRPVALFARQGNTVHTMTVRQPIVLMVLTPWNLLSDAPPARLDLPAQIEIQTARSLPVLWGPIRWEVGPRANNAPLGINAATALRSGHDARVGHIRCLEVARASPVRLEVHARLRMSPRCRVVAGHLHLRRDYPLALLALPGTSAWLQIARPRLVRWDFTAKAGRDFASCAALDTCAPFHRRLQRLEKTCVVRGGTATLLGNSRNAQQEATIHPKEPGTYLPVLLAQRDTIVLKGR